MRMTGDRSRARPPTRRGFLASAGAVLVAPCLAAPALVGRARAAERIVFASSGGTIEAFMRNEAIPAFERETGIGVVYVVGTSLSNYSRLLATRSRPEIDVYWANDLSHLGGKLQGLYERLDPGLVPNLRAVYPIARDPDGVGVASNLSGCGIQYNPRAFARAGLAAPTSWLDLWDPRLKGRVALYSIGVLFSQDFLAMMSRVLGGGETDVRPAIRKIRELRDMGNVAAFANSPAEMDNLLVQEQAWVACNAQPRAFALAKGGSDLRYVQPKEGSPLFTVLLDVVKGCPNPTGAQRFVNHMLREDVQGGIAAAVGYAPVNPKARLPQAFAGVMPSSEADLARLVPLDRAVMNRDLDDWTELWNREVEARR